jgi:hypothetical protein
MNSPTRVGAVPTGAYKQHILLFRRLIPKTQPLGLSASHINGPQALDELQYVPHTSRVGLTNVQEEAPGRSSSSKIGLGDKVKSGPGISSSWFFDKIPMFPSLSACFTRHVHVHLFLSH